MAEQRRKQMAALIAQLAPATGYTRTLLPDVRLLRSDVPLARTPVLYEPCIVVVCQGRKRGFLGDGEYIYDAQQYLVLSVPLPFASATEASAEEPMLAISLRLDLAVLADLLLTLDKPGDNRAVSPLSMASTPLDDRLGGAVLRLLESLTVSSEAKALGPGLLREIYYRVLMGEQGAAMRAALSHQGHFAQIAQALNLLQTGFAQHFAVADLARQVGMSVPAFHAHFKAVTQSSPMQYLKSTRLHQARLLMIRGGASAAAASAQVGYESPSQFSREFKRFFGRTPQQEAQYMKRILRLEPAIEMAG
ncbi:AraC-like DNA-binding protein [Erwinia toletana]|uniref:AraC-like DNA-binding protein n=1 Tax=Winslowiella toletana TaxID=92490 RepID=A0ABS4PAG7_9GAMM|nr:AraC-like DNA-binding protein [Winslowiella toletana]